MFPGQMVKMKVRIGPYSAETLTGSNKKIDFDIGNVPMPFEYAVAAGAGVAAALEAVRRARHPELADDDMLPDVGFAFEPAPDLETEVVGLEDFDPATDEEAMTIETAGETVSTEDFENAADALDEAEDREAQTFDDFNGEGVEL